MISALKSAVVFLFFLVLSSAVSCVPLDKNAAAAAYTSQIAACVERSQTKLASETCRHEVNRQWGVCGPKGDLCDSTQNEEPKEGQK